MVSWNTRDLMRRSLRSIYENTATRSLEVIVVDNASSDGSTQMVEREFPQAILRHSDRNLGLPKGYNVGIRLSRGRYILLINTDTLVYAAAIDKMLAYMQAHPDVGVLGPKLLWPDGRVQREAVGSFPSLRTAINLFFGLSKILPGYRSFQGMFNQAPDRVSEVDWVGDAVMFCRREALESVGLIPEDYFCYMEDVQCCLQMHRQNWKVVYFPEAEVMHYKEGATRLFCRPTTPNAWRSVTLYFEKNCGPFPARLLQPIAIAGFSVRVVAYSLATLFAPSPAVKGRLRQNASLLIMTLLLSWEMLTGREWRKNG